MRLFTNSRILGIALIALVSVSLVDCSVRVNSPRRTTTTVKAKRIPPGHAKKMSGDQSARRHAPGHNK